MAQAAHVPAWKRHKYGREDPIKSDDPNTNGITKPKQKAKRSDLNGHHSPPRTSNGTTAHTNGHRDGPPPAKKQKRVSFSPDTKLLDGDGDGASTARHAIPSELANANNGSSSTAKTNTGRKSKNADAAVVPTPAPASKPPKPAKKAKMTQTPPSKHKSQQMLDYLSRYYISHSSWKFQKNREVWILKHALSTEDIDTGEYGLALAQYVFFII
ncbi:hypothetical protein DV735_g4230, partial [Chaetothyriales sp. CBS 134920]